jgi:DNA modification methylase
VLRTLPDGSVDAVVTDPPYGIARVWKGGRGHGWGKADADKPIRNTWDAAPPQAEFWEEMRRVSLHQIVWGGNYFPLPQSRGWLVWVKPERNFTLSEAELAWTNRDTVMRVYDKGGRYIPDRQHPTQKPLGLMEWCLSFLPEGCTVLDPFMGSGTTGVACMNTGRNFIGVEIDPGYHAIAERRIREAKEAAESKLFAATA